MHVISIISSYSIAITILQTFLGLGTVLRNQHSNLKDQSSSVIGFDHGIETRSNIINEKNGDESIKSNQVIGKMIDLIIISN